MPVYQIVIEVDDSKRENGVMDQVEYVEAETFDVAANAAILYAKEIGGELKHIRFLIPTPRKI